MILKDNKIRSQMIRGIEPDDAKVSKQVAAKIAGVSVEELEERAKEMTPCNDGPVAVNICE